MVKTDHPIVISQAMAAVTTMSREKDGSSYKGIKGSVLCRKSMRQSCG
jgi:hypothetical protein